MSRTRLANLAWYDNVLSSLTWDEFNENAEIIRWWANSIVNICSGSIIVSLLVGANLLLLHFY